MALAMRESSLVVKWMKSDHRREEATYLEFAWFFQILLVNVVTAKPAVRAGSPAVCMDEHFIPERLVIL